MQNEIKAHSKLGASSYDRWSACPGSVKASEGIPSITSAYAEEGTKAHELAAEILNGEIDSFITHEEDMAEAVQVYVNYIRELRYARPDFEAIEQKLNLSGFHPDLFGTADYVCYFAHSKILHVVDYKHGKGIPVEVENSKQLMYYGLGALHQNKFPIEKIVLTIVQPRCFHPSGPIRIWETDPLTMLDFAYQLIDDAKKTEDPNAPLNPGDHCRFCPASPTCKAIEEKALVEMQSGFTDISNFDGERLAKALHAIPMIKAWCESVNEYAYRQASVGNIPPGFKLVDKRSTRRWKDDFKPADERYYEKKLKSPAAMDKILGKAAIEAFTVKESSGKNLVPISDDREPVKGAIEEMFT